MVSHTLYGGVVIMSRGAERRGCQSVEVSLRDGCVVNECYAL